MKKKILATALCLCACFTFSMAKAQPVKADTLVDSTASSATDITAGTDETQGQTTAYDDTTVTTTTYTGNNSVSLYATKTGWATVSIPKTLVLGKDENGKYSCTFKVDIQGDIAGAQSITVTPSATTTLSEAGGKTSTATANVTINDASNITVGANELLNGAIYSATGKVSASNITAGVWATNINFGVVVNYN